MMGRMQGPNADSDTTLPSSTEGDRNTGSSQSADGKHDRGSRLKDFPPSHSANEDVVENPTSTGSVEGQQMVTLSWLNDLNKGHQRRRKNPEDDDDADYTAKNDDDVEMGDPHTTRTKSTRISGQSKRAKVTHEARLVVFSRLS
jgi:hypothetical protein